MLSTSGLLIDGHSGAGPLDSSSFHPDAPVIHISFSETRNLLLLILLLMVLPSVPDLHGRDTREQLMVSAKTYCSIYSLEDW